MQHLRSIVVGLIIGGAGISPALAEEELKKLTDRLLAPPVIQTEAGFTAKILAPPGQLYDPLFMQPRDGGVWISDDGPERGDKGGRLMAVDQQGNVSAVLGIGTLLPYGGFDIAPKGFGAYTGQFFILTQPKIGMEGALSTFIVQRADPKQDHAVSIFCTLPPAGNVNKGIPAFGSEARFGPEGSPFAGKFYSLTAKNNTIYQTTADGQCTPFVTFDEQVGSPFALTFSMDGKTMLVVVARGGLIETKSSAIVRVSPDGTVEEKPVVEGQTVGGVGVAPEGFGSYGGQVFFTEVGDFQFPVPMTQSMTADGKLYRVTPEGERQLVATGFVNPIGVRFIGNTLWVSDINGDFLAGRRELPDGFVVEITAQ